VCLYYKLNATGEPLEILPVHTVRNLFSVVWFIFSELSLLIRLRTLWLIQHLGWYIWLPSFIMIKRWRNLSLILPGGPEVSFVNNQFNFWSVYCVVLCCVVNKVLTIFVKKVKLLLAVNRTYKQWNKLKDHLEGFIKHKKLLDDYTSAFLFRYS
jgi:hypothetical protein